MFVSGCWMVGVVLVLLWLLLSQVYDFSFVHMTDTGILEYRHHFQVLKHTTGHCRHKFCVWH